MNTEAARASVYRWGQRVIALDDIFNDGSHPEQAPDALLAARGTVGEVIKIGHVPQANEPVYLVQFDDCVVGCLEVELVAAPPGLWQEP